MELRDYLDTLTQQIRCKKARPAVEREILNHISDQAQAYEEDGMEHDQALKEAVRQMGDPVEAGAALDRVHRPGMEWGILLLVLVLSVAGLAIQFVLFHTVDPEKYPWNAQNAFYSQLIYTFIGLVCMFAVYFLDYSLIGKYPLLLWLGFGGLLLFLVQTPILPRINGQLRLYSPLTLFAPLFAGLLFRFRGGGFKSLIGCGVLCLLPLWLCARSVQTTGLVEMGFIFLIMASIAVARRWYRVPVKMTLASIWAGTFLFLCALIFSGRFLAPYQMARINAWLHPGRYLQEANYQRSMILRAVSGFRLNGGSTFPADPLPNGWIMDFSVTAMFSRFGILFGAGVLLLIVLFLVRALYMVMKQKNQLGAMTGLGCCLVLLLQSATYIASNFGVGLLTQKTIPFLTFGLQSTVVNYILIGLILSVYRFKDVLSDSHIKSGVRYRIRVEKIDGGAPAEL